MTKYIKDDLLVFDGKNINIKMRLEKMLKELDNECTVVYKAGQQKEFKALNKIYNMLRKYKVLYESLEGSVDKDILLMLIINWYELARSSLRNKNVKIYVDENKYIDDFINVISTAKDNHLIIRRYLGDISNNEEKIGVLSTTMSGLGIIIEKDSNMIALDTSKFVDYVIDNMEKLVDENNKKGER